MAMRLHPSAQEINAIEEKQVQFKIDLEIYVFESMSNPLILSRRLFQKLACSLSYNDENEQNERISK